MLIRRQEMLCDTLEIPCKMLRGQMILPTMPQCLDEHLNLFTYFPEIPKVVEYLKDLLFRT